MSTEAAQIVDSMQATQAPPQAPESVTTEPTVEATAPSAAAPEERVSSKIETLIKREQAALARERAAKQKEADIQARMAEIEAKASRISEFESVKQNPKKALELLGLSYDELSQALMNDGNLTPDIEIKRIREEFSEFKRAQELEKERLAQEAKKQAEEQLSQRIDAFKKEIKTYLGDNSSRYELIAFEKQEALVYDVIDEHYTRTIDPETGVGKVMSIAEAADKVEEWLEQKYQKSKDVGKVKALWGAAPRDAQGKFLSQQPSKPVSQPPKTLTNQLSATPSRPRSTILTDEERKQRAIEWLKQQKQGLVS